VRTISFVTALVISLAGVASGQQPRQAGASLSEPRTWSTPWDKTRPRDPYADQQGRVWFVGQVGNYVARLDPRTGDFKRYEIDPGTHPHDLVVDRRGMVWFTGNANGRIVRLDPATGKLATFPMPDPSVRDPHTMIFDRKGDAWFTAQGAGVVGRLTTADGKIRLWKMATGSRPYGIAVDSHDQPWFDLFGTNQIGTIDPRSGQFKAYTLPNERTRPRRIVVGPDDAIWYGDYTRGFLGRSIPSRERSTNTRFPRGSALCRTP
jgi:Streptogramin lyase